MKNKVKYPKVGDVFYWKDEDNIIHEATCMKIEGEDIDTLETMFFTYVSNTGGGCFVTESDIVNSTSKEVADFKKAKYKAKINELVNMLNDETLHTMMYSALRKNYDEDTSSEIIDILSNEDNYD